MFPYILCPRKPRWKSVREYLLILLTALAFASAIPMQVFLHQELTYSFNRPAEIWLILALFLPFAALICSLYFVILKTPLARIAATLSAIYMFLSDFDERSVSGLGVLTAIFPKGKLIILGLFILAVCYGIGRLLEWLAGRINRIDNTQAAVMTGLIAIGIFLSNTVSFSAYTINHQKTLSYVPSNHDTDKPTSKTTDKDIVYIVLDRYSNNESLRNYYHFDNDPFLESLRSQGFTVRDDAYSNYHYTGPSISSTLRMDYHTDLAEEFADSPAPDYLPYRTIIADAPVVTKLDEAGYDIFNLTSWYGISREINKAQNISYQYELNLFGNTHLLSDYQEAAIRKSYIGTIFRENLHFGPITIGRMEQRNYLDTINQLRQTANLATEQHGKPRFIFTHIIAPHPPYLFGPDGTLANYYDSNDNDIGGSRSLKYINQLKYVNTLVNETIAKIKSSSKSQPIIIIQSDEGPYPMELLAANTSDRHGNFDWNKASADTIKEKTGILAAYHLPDLPEGVAPEISSPVNLFRFIFNNYFGASYSYLPDCSFVAETDRIFRYIDVTAKLRGAEDPACKKLAR